MIMQQTIKYGTDEYGNVWHDFAQIEPVGGTVCFNPTRETLVEPPEIPEGKRLLVENGDWKIIMIDSENTLDKGRIRPKTEMERMRDGIDEIPKGFKLVDLTLVAKTLEEQLSTNEITKEEYANIKLNECYANRRLAYSVESDGIFFDYQRGEVDKQVWLDKISEIKLRYPKP